MGLRGWIPITDYAGKYRVSISTLRRRIKSGNVEYSFSEGKYLLKDLPLGKHGQNISSAAQVTTAPPQQPSGQPAPSSALSQVGQQPVAAQALNQAASRVHTLDIQEAESPVLATANRILNELKKAYSLILQEKEQQILHLRAEVADLKTLVQVLESENDRLNLR